jgi:hypothetical protein
MAFSCYEPLILWWTLDWLAERRITIIDVIMFDPGFTTEQVLSLNLSWHPKASVLIHPEDELRYGDELEQKIGMDWLLASFEPPRYNRLKIRRWMRPRLIDYMVERRIPFSASHTSLMVLDSHLGYHYSDEIDDLILELKSTPEHLQGDDWPPRPSDPK